MINKLRIINNMGFSWTVFRAKYEMMKRLGWLEKQYPTITLTDEEFLSRLQVISTSKEQFVQWWKGNRQPFFVSLSGLNQYRDQLEAILGNEKENLILQADEICDHCFTYFSNWTVKYNHLNWHLNPITGKEASKELHWTKIPDLNGSFGDIKYIWEISRFSFVYTLVRAFTVTDNSKYIESFWSLFEDWVSNNPPELGVNYKCSQEMSLRLMAWVFGLYAFADHPISSSDRIYQLIKQIYMHTVHIEKHFGFALKSVRNNHTISESVGMFTAGLLFPFFDISKKCFNKGFKYLEEEGLRQIYSDGSYLQHSFNYQRLVIQDYTWVFRIAQLNEVHFSCSLRGRVLQCVLFLFNQQDESTGRLPNYGMNDGALIHPLASCDYLDYRPQLNALFFLLKGKRLYPSGKYDENLIWISGEEALSAPLQSIPRLSNGYTCGGYFVIRSKESHAMVRCANYYDRPYQADMLHFDLWWRGVNITCDAGAYSYNTGASWMSYFNGTSSHNTIQVDNKDQMQKGSRFVWYNWTKSKTISFDVGKPLQIFEGEHYGYSPIIHRRAVLHWNENWIVIDDLLGDFKAKGVNINQNWLLGVNQIVHSTSQQLTLLTTAGHYHMSFIDDVVESSQTFFGDEVACKGWMSKYYGNKQPALQLLRYAHVAKPTRLITVFSPDNLDMEYRRESGLLILGQYRISLNPIGHQSITNNNK